MAAVVDLKGIKDQIKSILDTANTTTASADLSANLVASRVQKVLTIHPEKINPQASFFPLVTSFITDKEFNREDIAGSQTSAKRRAKIGVSIVGAVWNDKLVTDLDDPADTDINYLMENIELILRSNPSLNSKVTWQVPVSTKYYSTALDEQTHLRTGILEIDCTVFY